jgi:hypothetical protein
VETNTIEHLRMADDFMVSNDRLVEIAINLKNAVHGSEARQNACLFGVNGRGCAHARINACLSRSVACGAVFEKSALKDL